ncbi:hypothetical protein CspeluHIS016_0104970 [Cutaneotrichosporon spelunceum]|uniref:CCZ1/INTU/HSP4 first Longin domain-containing protein n=1 Tax=Cutaneotrichosporon spelunceum TaxID=1672016 RepID=A0AAD3TP55_9TREE|nr:hypothetical protein CspeluHIS016_0104970 [Cutaneotrichosporon spelunceum]
MQAPGADHLPSLAHFVIFNPTLARRPPKNKEEDAAVSGSVPERDSLEERDRDLEDDLREAAQIVFYTAREAGGVSRDRMLRQVGLTKGLMGFADMVVVDATAEADTDAPVYWAIHAQHQRLLVYSPEPDWFIYINISLPRDKDKDAKDKDTPAPPPPLSDSMLVEGLRRGYDDFCLLHASLESHLPPTPSGSSLIERYWTRFAFGFETAYLNPGPAYPLQAWLGGWPAELNDAALSDALVEFAEEDKGAGLVSPKRPLMVTAPASRGREGEALMRYLLGRLVALPPVPAPKPERLHLGFKFGRRTPVSLNKDVLKVAEANSEPRKTSWGLASPLSWVGFAASAPASRTATPLAVPKPAPTAATPSGLSRSVDEKSKPERATPRPTGATHKPRWHNLGVSFGDAVGNVGAVFGISSSPKMESRLSQEVGQSGTGTATPAQSESSETAQGEEKGDEDAKGRAVESAEAKPAESNSIGTGSEEKEAKAKEANKVATDGPEAQPEEHPQSTGGGEAESEATAGATLSEDKGASAVPSPQLTPAAAEDHPAGIAATPLQTTPDDTRTSTPVMAPAELPVELPLEPMTEQTVDAGEAPLCAADISQPTRPRSCSLVPGLDDRASVTGSQASVADLDAAIHSDVEMSWESRIIYLEGQRRRLFWIIRDRTLLFVIRSHDKDDEGREDGSASPSTTAALRVFAAYSSHSEKQEDKERERERPTTTVYHAGSVTDSSGSMDTAESGTLAALRVILHSGIGEVFAQAPGGKFAIAKRAEEGDGELYAFTGRMASLTDAERAVREVALLRPEFT